MKNPTWVSDDPMPDRALHGVDYIRIFLRVIPMLTIVFGCLLILLFLRVFEKPIFGTHRPITPYITQFVCRSVLAIIGLKCVVYGRPMDTAGPVISNHTSWLDIFVLNARDHIYFVAKSEVASWPGIGWLARATGTMFIERDRTKAIQQTESMNARLKLGHRLLFFPEGTTSDNQRVLPFKPTLFQSFLSDDLRDELHVQPVTISFQAPKGTDPRYYGWWGDEAFAAHFFSILALKGKGCAIVEYHEPVKVSEFTNRKEMAAAMEMKIRSRLQNVI